MFRNLRTAVVGYSSGKLFLFFSNNLYMVSMTSYVSMFGYMAMAYDVKSFVPGGKGLFYWSRHCIYLLS